MDNSVVWLEFIAMIPAIACGCVLPIIAIWLIVRQKMNESKDRTQIITTAIEKNPDMDIEELMKKISPKQKMLKEKLLSKLLWGCITSVIGLGLIGLGIYLFGNGEDKDDALTSICFGVILLAVGGAFIINYGVGKKMLAKELEAEQNNLTKQQ